MSGLIILVATMIILFGIAVSTSDKECPCHHGGLLCSFCENELESVEE